MTGLFDHSLTLSPPSGSRRSFLQAAGAAATTPALLGSARAEPGARPDGRADSCIFLWLGGGACHIDTWDPKRKGDGKMVAGSYYDPIDTVIPGVQVCQHLKRSARLLDRCAVLRGVHHEVIDEHAAATNRVHTGRPPTGTTVYPSIGSIVAHQRGAAAVGVPPYIVMGYPSASRGPGFLGSGAGYLYLTDTRVGPAGLQRPNGVNSQRQARREKLLGRLRRRFLQRNRNDNQLRDYATTAIEGLKLAGPKFMNVFDLKSENDRLRQAYGSEFGQRCLLARRLVESGVRFVEVSFNLNFINGTGWDTHNQGQKQQHVLIDQLDQAFATLITDLEKRQRLDRTLIVIATEFGRPPEFDRGGGRGHYSKAFSIVLAGGGLKTGQAIGTTDELGRKILDRPVSIPDLHATIYRSLSIDPTKELYDGVRPVPITDKGQAVDELFT
ncbi:MAG: hypothetical protein CMJ65_01355 [Planctomycetaceae bacterium]|jgi:hypothetical protein|nr:hypothetical protein [Planctomycetaceae bacterium]MDP7275144.1 DUF1501 domain-containing protein [Planctomycetaceae bacterium]